MNAVATDDTKQVVPNKRSPRLAVLAVRSDTASKGKDGMCFAMLKGQEAMCFAKLPTSNG